MATTITPFPDIGLPCPEFNLLGVDGKNYSLKDFSTGQPLVVMFICNHCPYVQAVEDRLIQLGRDLKALNIPVVGICANDEDTYPEDNLANLKKRWQEKQYTFPYIQDKTQEVAKKFGALCTPDFFVYDKNLKLAYRGRLDNSWKDASKVTHRELFDAVKLLAEGKPSPQQQTPSMGCSIKWI